MKIDKDKIFCNELKPQLDSLLFVCQTNGIEIVVSVVLDSRIAFVSLPNEIGGTCKLHARINKVFDQQEEDDFNELLYNNIVKH